MNNYFIILAAGNSTRFRSKIPKQYSMYKGIQTFQHSINKALESKLFKKVILVIIDDLEIYTYKPLTKSTNFHDLSEKPRIYLTLRGVSDVSLTSSPDFFITFST